MGENDITRDINTTKNVRKNCEIDSEFFRKKQVLMSGVVNQEDGNCNTRMASCSGGQGLILIKIKILLLLIISMVHVLIKGDYI